MHGLKAKLLNVRISLD